MTRRAIILKYRVEDLLFAVYRYLARFHQWKQAERVTWPIGTPWWRKSAKEEE